MWPGREREMKKKIVRAVHCDFDLNFHFRNSPLGLHNVMDLLAIECLTFVFLFLSFSTGICIVS